MQTGQYTPASVVDDEPIELKLDNGEIWKPGNYDHKIHGQVTLLRALTQSYNLATVNLGMEVGLTNVAKTYVQLGLDSAPPKFPSILLGAAQLNPVEVAQMYNTLANGGFRSPLRAVRAVVDEGGKPLKAPELEVTEAAPTEAIYTLDRMLDRSVRPRHRATGPKSLPPTLVVAGKTGTSNDYRDSWFAGFSGGHLIIVWMGHDDNTPTGLTGTTGALPVWTRLMGSISTNSFEPLMPEDVEDRWIEYYTGLRDVAVLQRLGGQPCRSRSVRCSSPVRSARRTRRRRKRHSCRPVACRLIRRLRRRAIRRPRLDLAGLGHRQSRPR